MTTYVPTQPSLPKYIEVSSVNTYVFQPGSDAVLMVAVLAWEVHHLNALVHAVMAH